MVILVANIGSTSFKYRLFAMPETVLGQGRVERIGGGDCPDYATAIARCIGEIAGPGKALESLEELSAVAFKAVHAGPLGGARVIDDGVLAAMEEFAFFAPAHNPPYIAAMRAFRQALPRVPLVALFETAFFEGLEEAAVTYAVPYEWKADLGVRRYGFHGASHRAAADKAKQLVGQAISPATLRHISCHLGGSSSMAAILGGAAIDTSFGISPQSGLPHNNRTGDLDVFAALYVMRKRGLDVDQMAAKLASESGLAGISGTSGDIRDVARAAASGNARARLALEVLVRSIRHYLGAFLVELGGLDILTFSGGIGENSAEIRAGVCRGLEPFGIILDSERNASARGESRISADGSPVTIWIVPADEERVVAQAAARVLTSHIPENG